MIPILFLVLGCEAAPVEPSPDVREAEADVGADPSTPETDPVDKEEVVETCALASPCDDGDSCTWGDQCDLDGACVGEAYSCDDGQPCTTGACDGEGGCGFGLTEGFCYIGGLCATDGEDHPENPCLGCVASQSQVGWSSHEGRTCDDGDLCTADDRCMEGTCGSDTSVACADGNPCTDDSCDPDVGCLIVPNQDSCDDGLADTKDDVCDGAGTCVGTSFSCEVEGPCVESAVPNGEGCSFIYVVAGTTCDDGVKGTRGDFCDGFGGCVGSAYSCDASSPCVTSAEPNGEGCDFVYESAAATCDDNLANTKDDHCDGAGLCAGTEYTCEVTNFCVESSVPNGVDCSVVYLSEGSLCDDGALTTKDDQCDGMGACAGATYSCDASDPCVAASQPDGVGCDIVWADAAALCDDGSDHTKGDHCDGSGGCSGTEYSCQTDSPCVLTALPNGTDCSTVYRPEGTECDDGLLTTAGDHCDGGALCVGTALVCEAPSSCVLSVEPNGEVCAAVYALAGTLCDDGSTETYGDKCDGVGGCAGYEGCPIDPTLPGSPCAQPQCAINPGTPACSEYIIAFCADNMGAAGCVEEQAVPCEFELSNPGNPCASAECQTDTSSVACFEVASAYCNTFPEDPGCEDQGDEAEASDCEFLTDREGSPCYMGVWVDICVDAAEACEAFIVDYCYDNQDDPACEAYCDETCDFDKTNPDSPCYLGTWVGICDSGTPAACEAFIVAYCGENPSDSGCVPSDDGGEDGEEGSDDCDFDKTNPDSPCYQGAWVGICDSEGPACEAFIEDYCGKHPNDSGCNSSGSGGAGDDDCAFDKTHTDSPCYQGTWVSACASEGTACEGFIEGYCAAHPDDAGCSPDSGESQSSTDCPYDAENPANPCMNADCIADYLSAACVAYEQAYCTANDDPVCPIVSEDQ